MGSPPPPQLVHALVHGPSIVSGLDWHDEVGSTNALAAEAAARGVPEVHVVLADVQTAGRGRHGRAWTAPPGTSLLQSLVVRPQVPRQQLGLLPLLAGVALAEAVAPFLPGLGVALKWPNDLLLRPAPEAPWRKAAGILVESLPDGASVVGTGLNVDWRGVQRPEALREATSLAEVAEAATGRALGMDRWRVFIALIAVFGNRYRRWPEQPDGFLDEYRARCVTLGQTVSVGGGGGTVAGVAEGLASDGALEVRVPDGRLVRLLAGDVAHVRPAG